MTTNSPAVSAGAHGDVLNSEIDIDLSGAETLESALELCGWKPTGDRRSWVRGTGRHKAMLTELLETADWRHFSLESGELPKSTNARVLFDNIGLSGPMKLVAQPSGAPLYRLDVPSELIEPAGTTCDSFDSAMNSGPIFFWATAGTTGLTGRSAVMMSNMKSTQPTQNIQDLIASFAATSGRIVEQLKSAGWAASEEEGRVFVNVTLPGIFRQVEISAHQDGGDRPTGIVAGCDLVTFPADAANSDGGPAEADNSSQQPATTSDSVRAIVQLAQQANARLPLVRLAVDRNGSPWRLRAEVRFCVTPIPGAWLLKALEAIQTAVATTALEFEALRGDAELSKLVLATSVA